MLKNLQRRYPLHLPLFKKQSLITLQLLKKEWPAHLLEVSVFFVSPQRICQLHDDFLQDPTETDVITFHHGEIFICPAVAEKQRQKENLSLHDEILTYIIHGFLHLCGWDDHSPRDYDRMRHRQTALLKQVKQKFS